MNIPFIAESKNILFLPAFLAVIVCTAAMSMLINKFENIKAKFVLVVSVILFILFLLLTVEDYKKTEEVQQNVLFEELCQQIEGCTNISE
jgi:uncharacterized membrane protein